uniref:Uncharacterized protein n=1 Tax=Anguilla anguilla TaxID=7936 RepID=A0A0E9TZD0_ANGAN
MKARPRIGGKNLLPSIEFI